MSSFSSVRSHIFFPTVLILITAAAAVGQSSQPGPTASQSANSPAPSGSPLSGGAQGSANSPAQTGNSVAPSTTIQVTPSGEASQVNPVLRRIERARAMAAAHQLQLAATDLENVRASVNDIALRNVTTLMLIGIYLEEGNYVRAQALLEESFQSRAVQKDESLRTYFAMAGQTIIGIRSHLAHYRSFGINPSDTDLPAEANVDLERVRNLLERVAAQAKEISGEAGRSYDAVALQEDVVGIRLSLARDTDDRDKWQIEYVGVREKLAFSQAQTTSVGRSALLDAIAARIPNPFAANQNAQLDSATQAQTGSPSTSESDKPTGAPNLQPGTQVAAASSNASTSEKPEPQLISSGLLSGRESKRVTPSYPTVARNAGVTGTVRVFAIVDENGKVWVTNSEGPVLLRKAAEDAAKNWTFPPTLVSGKPVRVAGYLDFDFKL